MRFWELIDFRKTKTPGYGLSRGFYMSVLSPTSVLPTPRDWVAPNGPLPGMIAPLAGGPEFLDRPLERGAYAITSMDKKSVLRCVVVCKEEAGFDPNAYLAHPSSHDLHPDIRAAIAATWTLIQLSFEGHDPMVAPSLHFILSLTSRLAEYVGGVVADPLAEDYLCPNEARPRFEATGPILAPQVIRVHSPKAGHVFTMGMRKFGLPEFELQGFSADLTRQAQELLLASAQTVLNHGPMSEGALIGDTACALKVVAGGLDRARWEGIPCLELIPEKTGALDQAILAGSQRK